MSIQNYWNYLNLTVKSMTGMQKIIRPIITLLLYKLRYFARIIVLPL